MKKLSEKPSPYCAEIALWDPDRACQYKDIAHFALVYELVDMLVSKNEDPAAYTHIWTLHLKFIKSATVLVSGRELQQTQ